MNTTPMMLSIALLLISAISQAADPKVDLLLEGMKTGEEARLVQARQLLPYQDPVAATPELVKLISHEDERIWRAAYNVLADYANMTAVPGKEAARQVVASALMGLLAPERSAHEKEQGLRLLPQALPPGFDLSPMAALLGDADTNIREKARAALQETGTPEAGAALLSALPGSEPVFQAALLDALAEMGAAGSPESVVDYARTGEPQVRVSAARVLAQTGKLEYLPVLRDLCAQATPELHAEATRALVELVNQLALRGGKWEVAMAEYQRLLGEEQDPVLRGVVLSSLGRFGAAEQIPLIVQTAAESEQLNLAGPAIRALEYRHGRAGREALLAAYPSAPAPMQPALLALFGRQQDVGFTELLAKETQNADAATRDAAREALAVGGAPEAVQPLVQALESAPAEEKAAVTAQLQKLAAVLRTKGAPQTGVAYVALYRAAQDDAARADALQGIKQFPVAEAYDIIVGAMGQEELEKFPAAVLAGVARVLKESGRDEESKKMFELVLARMDSPAAMQEVLALAPQLGYGPELNQRLGFLHDWHLVGPFPWKMPEGFSAEGIDANAPKLDAPLSLAGATASWKAVHTDDATGIVDLTGQLGDASSARAYAFTTVESAEETEGVIRMGSDDGIAVWVNGEKVFENNVDRGLALDQDMAKFKLKQGANSILLEISQGGGGWNFAARITRADGQPLK